MGVKYFLRGKGRGILKNHFIEGVKEGVDLILILSSCINLVIVSKKYENMNPTHSVSALSLLNTPKK